MNSVLCIRGCILFIPMGASFGSACLQSINRSESDLLAVIRSLSSLVVVTYAVTAICSGVMCKRWLQLTAESRSQLWSQYGRFTGFMCAGSCFGILTWTCNAFQIALIYIDDALPDDALQEQARIYVVQNRWWAAYFIFYVPEMVCIFVTKVAVLERMAFFSSSTLQPQQQERLARGKVALMFIIIAGNVVGFAANVAAAVYALQAAAVCQQAYEAFEKFGANSTVGIDFLNNQMYPSNNAFTANGIQLVSEVVILFAIIAAFAVAGCLSLRRFMLAGAVIAPPLPLPPPPRPLRVHTCSHPPC